MFRTIDNKGFEIVFNNGVKITTRFGDGDHCDNFNRPDLKFPSQIPAECKNAEVSITNAEDGPITEKIVKKVLGYDPGDWCVSNIEPHEWVKIIIACEAY